MTKAKMHPACITHTTTLSLVSPAVELWAVLVVYSRKPIVRVTLLCRSLEEQVNTAYQTESSPLQMLSNRSIDYRCDGIGHYAIDWQPLRKWWFRWGSLNLY